MTTTATPAATAVEAPTDPGPTPQVGASRTTRRPMLWAGLFGLLTMFALSFAVAQPASAAPISGSRTYTTSCGTLQTYNSSTPGWKNIRWINRPYGDSWMNINGAGDSRASAIGVYLGSRSSFRVTVTCVRARDCAIQSFTAY